MEGGLGCRWGFRDNIHPKLIMTRDAILKCLKYKHFATKARGTNANGTPKSKFCSIPNVHLESARHETL